MPPPSPRARRSTTTSRAAPPRRAATLSRSSSCRASRSTSATRTARPARSNSTCRPGTGTSTAPWRSSAARSPGTTSASTTWTPRSRKQALVYAERGFRTGAEKIAQLAKDNDFTLRQTVEFISSPKPTPFAGSPATVADQIQEWFEARALDGLNVGVGHPGQWRRFREEVVPDPAGARHRPHRVRGHDPPRQPGPHRPGQPLHQGPRRAILTAQHLKIMHPRRPVTWRVAEARARPGHVFPGHCNNIDLFDRHIWQFDRHV